MLKNSHKNHQNKNFDKDTKKETRKERSDYLQKEVASLYSLLGLSGEDSAQAKSNEDTDFKQTGID